MPSKETDKKLDKQASRQIKKKFLIIGAGILFILGVFSIIEIWTRNNAKINSTKPQDNLPALSKAQLNGARTEVIGANMITTDNLVVTNKGERVLNSAPQGSELAPMQTGPISRDALLPSTIKIDVGNNKFIPSDFFVKAGEPITLALTSIDNSVHSFVFNDTSLQAVVLGVLSKETKAMTFSAPNKTGEYTFYCAVDGHQDRGEIGKMIVQ